MMNPSREEALLAIALEIPADKRAALVDALCVGLPDSLGCPSPGWKRDGGMPSLSCSCHDRRTHRPWRLDP